MPVVTMLLEIPASFVALLSLGKQTPFYKGPRTMIETMACASPFLGTRITGIVDHIRDGENGFLVEPRDSAGLAQKLDQILQNRELARKVGNQGLAYVRQNLAWDVVVSQVRSQVYAPLVPESVDGLKA